MLFYSFIITSILFFAIFLYYKEELSHISDYVIILLSSFSLAIFLNLFFSFPVDYIGVVFGSFLCISISRKYFNFVLALTCFGIIWILLFSLTDFIPFIRGSMLPFISYSILLILLKDKEL